MAMAETWRRKGPAGLYTDSWRQPFNRPPDIPSGWNEQRFAGRSPGLRFLAAFGLPGGSDPDRFQWHSSNGANRLQLREQLRLYPLGGDGVPDSLL